MSIDDPGRGPLTVPVWYAYAPGGVVRIVTAAGSEKARLLRAAGRLSLCVQSETPPYRYVTVEGPVTFRAPDHERDVRALARRYLGPDMGEAYQAPAVGGGRRVARVRLLADVNAALAGAGVPHALIGAAALAAHGVTRATADVDVLTTDARALDPFVLRTAPGRSARRSPPPATARALAPGDPAVSRPVRSGPLPGAEAPPVTRASARSRHR